MIGLKWCLIDHSEIDWFKVLPVSLDELVNELKVLIVAQIYKHFFECEFYHQFLVGEGFWVIVLVSCEFLKL